MSLLFQILIVVKSSSLKIKPFDFGAKHNKTSLRYYHNPAYIQITVDLQHIGQKPVGCHIFDITVKFLLKPIYCGLTVLIFLSLSYLFYLLFIRLSSFFY